MKSFTATAIAAEEIPHINVFVLVLAEHRDGGGQRFEMQKALTAEEQAGENGQDTYCICTESGAAHYGVHNRFGTWRTPMEHHLR